MRLLLLRRDKFLLRIYIYGISKHVAFAKSWIMVYYSDCIWNVNQKVLFFQCFYWKYTCIGQYCKIQMMMHRLHPLFIDNKILWRRYLEVIDFNNNVCETANLSHKPTELIFYANWKQKTCINNVRILCYLFYKLPFYFSA